MRVTNYIFFLVLIGTFLLYGCGPEEDNSQEQPPPPDNSQSIDETKEDTNPLIEAHIRQREQFLEKYNKILKPNAPLPVKTYKTACTKEESATINIVVNEYTSSPGPGNGRELVCDFLQNGKVIRFATVEKNHCGTKAEEQIDKLKKEGYSCPPLELQQLQQPQQQ